MYCKQCGAELSENDKFCGACGAAQETVAEETSVAHIAEAGRAAVQGLLKKAETSGLFSEAIQYGKGVLSAEPTRTMDTAASSRSLFWLPAILANMVLFAFAVCHNLAQLLDRGIGWFIHTLITYLKEVVPGGSATFFGAEDQLAIDISPLYPLFVPLILVVLLVLAVEFVGMYLPFCLAKQKPESVHPFLNVLAVSTLPLTLACLVNLLLGLIFPVATICALVAALLVHITLLQEGMKQLGTLKFSPVWRIALTGFVTCAILCFALGLLAENGLRDMFDMMAKSGMNFLSSTFGNLYNGLFSFLG